MTHKPKILVVEDEPASLRQLETTLKAMGASPRCLSSSRQAAQLIGREKFDGVFLNWDTPELRGSELTQIIRRSRSNSKVPIAMLTRHNDTRAIAEGFQIGVTFFLSKPIGAKELGRLLNASRGAMLEERRRYQRAPMKIPVVCEWDDQRQSGRTEDVSASGMLIALPEAPETGTRLSVSFPLPGVSSRLWRKAKVVRTAPGPKIGIQFDRVSRAERELISRAVDRVLSRLAGR